MNKFFYFLLLSSFSLSSFASSDECIDGETRIAPATGAVFTCDTTKFKNAFRDPSGLIWSDISWAPGGYSLKLPQNAAVLSCERRIGGRTPNEKDFAQLATYLGKGSANGYSRYDGNNKPLLPFLEDIRFSKIWSSDKNTAYDRVGRCFAPASGNVGNCTDYREHLFLCVSN